MIIPKARPVMIIAVDSKIILCALHVCNLTIARIDQNSITDRQIHNQNKHKLNRNNHLPDLG